jgi:hypothetical protein
MEHAIRPKPDRRKSTRSSAAKAVAAATSVEIPKDAIARRAFELFCARGGQNGTEVDDWLRAERELTSELAGAAAAPARAS